MRRRRSCNQYTVDRRTVASVIDHLVKKEQAQQLVVTTASEGEKAAMQKVVLVTLPGVTAEDDRVHQTVARWAAQQAEKMDAMKSELRRQSLLECVDAMPVMIVRLLGLMVLLSTHLEEEETCSVEVLLSRVTPVQWVCMYGHHAHSEVLDNQVSDEVAAAWREELQSDLVTLNVAFRLVSHA